MGQGAMTERLSITVEGATAEEIERGLAAARQVFEGAGCTAWEAASASWRRELLDTQGVYALADAVYRLRERGADPAEVAAAEAELVWLKCQPGMHSLTEREDEIADYWDVADQAEVHRTSPTVPWAGRSTGPRWWSPPRAASSATAPGRRRAAAGDCGTLVHRIERGEVRTLATAA